VYNAEGRTKFRLEGRCAAQTGSGSPRNSVVAGPFTAMIAIPITPAAYEAIKRMSPKTNAASLGADGLVRIWLDRRDADQLGQLRGAGESYIEVILRLAKASS
jgi:hypothetical protein